MVISRSTITCRRKLLWVAAFYCALLVSVKAVPTKLGDIDGDGVFTVLDLAKLVGHSTGSAPLNETLIPFADLNQDGFVNDADQVALVKLILGTSTPQTLPLAVVQSTSPLKGEGDVAVTRETVLHFSIPLALNAAVDTTMLHADFGGRKILSRVEVSSDRRKATLFYLEPLPSSARIKVTFDTAGVNDLLGRPLDGDADGVSGGVFTTLFDTISITPVASTAISGRVFASERATGGAEVALAGVTVTVDGAEETLRCVTDALGNFTLSPCPAGSFFVHVDGRTSPQSHYPDGSYYPSVGKRWEAIAGSAANLSGNTEDPVRGTIYLPNIINGSLNAVSQTQDTTVDLPQSVLDANPGLAGTRLMVPANSLFADDGTRGGKVGMAPVAPDRLPSPLPQGLQLPMVITIQTDGATNFDRPVPISFPNLPVNGVTLKPGEKSALWSFNHDTGRWEIVGPMTVTEDGKFVQTDAGVGIRQPGWHGSQPGSGGGGGGPPPPPPPKPPCRKSTGAYIASAWDLAKQAYDCAKSISGAKAGIDCAINAIDATKALLTALSSFADQYNAGTLGTVEGAETTLNIIKAERDKIVGLIDCYKSADPLGKAQAAFNCIGNLLAATVVICDALAPAPNAPPECNPPPIQVTVCKGLSVANALHAYAKTYVDLAANFEEKTAKEVALFVIDNAIARAQLVVAAIKAGKPAARKGPGAMVAGATPLTAAEAADFYNALKDIKASVSSLQVSLAPFAEIQSTTADLEKAFNGVISGASETLYELGGSAPRPETFYYKLDYSGQTFRGKTGPGGQLNLIMPPEIEYTLSMFCPSGMLYGSVGGLSGANGSQFSLNRPLVASIAADTDTDNDGLPDKAEVVLGTDPNNSDSDGDGLTDGAEVQQGTNPLDGLIATTGVIASIPTTAPAIDVCAVNNMVVTANGNGGISVFNALSGLNPTRIADVLTPGVALAVACNGSQVAVAAYQSGLAVVDVSNPATVQVSHLLPLGSPVQAVAVSGPVGYAGTTQGQVVSVDLASGIELGRVTVSGSAAVQDLAVWRDTLYVLQSGKVTALDADTLVVYGSLGLANPIGAGGARLRLFAGDGTLYAANTNGFNIIDTLASPTSPSLVQNYTNNQFGWRQVVANGSGLALAATGNNSTSDGAHNVDLYTLGANQRTPAFAATFEAPGSAHAVAIYNGLGYVADDTAGLQVISYKPYDTLHQPPTITLSSAFPFDYVNKTGTAEEGKLMRLSAAVTDDVQVRNVEFYVNGLLVLVDGNYPFEHRFTTPALSGGSGSFKVKARATDTGGNATWSDEFTITLVPDATPPHVRSIYPGNNAIFASLTSLYAVFDEPMDPASLTGASFKLVEAGPDKTLDSTDDVVVTTGFINYREATKSAFMEFSGAGLPPGLYKVTVQQPAADVAGNKLAASSFSTFRVYNANLDADGDGIPDDWEALLGLNPNNAHTYSYNLPDGDLDYDGDGLSNAKEFVMGTNPMIYDTNGNGIADGYEDTDGDGLSDREEFAHGTSPFKVDTDGDGQDDATEIFQGTNPNVANGRLITIQSPTVSLLNAYLPPANDVAAANGIRSVASPPVFFLNTLAEPTPPEIARTAVSKVVSMLNTREQPRLIDSGLVSFNNTIADQVPPMVVTSAVSPVVSFVNSKAETLPASLAVGIASLPVSYLNLKTEALPADAEKSAVSPLVIYRNIPPAASASVNPPGPLAPKSLSSN